MSEVASSHVDKTGLWTSAHGNCGIAQLRGHLENHNGIAGLEVFKPSELEHAVTAFRRDGFVVIENVLNSEQTAFLREGCNQVVDEILALDDDRKGNRGSHRYSFGGSSLTRGQLHRSEWQMLLEVPFVLDVVGQIFGSPDYILRAASGDFCLGGAHLYQPLHSDIVDWQSASRTPFSSFYDPSGQMSLRDLPCPYVCVNFLPQDVTKLNGPTRQIPGTQNSRQPIPKLEDEPEWMRLSTVCPAPAGAIMIRDVRAWHGGTPNLTDTMRAIPNLEFYAPWFHEPIMPSINYRDFKKLSQRAQKIARYCVADSSVELITGPTLRAP